MKSIYKSAESKKIIQNLYDKKLKSLGFPLEEIDVQTSFGRTRVIKTGNEQGKKIILFHGIHAGAPLTLETVKELRKKYQLFAIDTIGQATKSDETILNIKDESFATWADEVLEGLAIEQANFIGISYGAFILQKLVQYKPTKIEKCIFIVPSGLANGAFWPSFTKLTLPLIQFQLTKKDAALRNFIKPFVPKDDQYMFDFQKAILLGLHMDLRRPTLLEPSKVQHFKNPVYMIVAENDIFFPADKTIKRAKSAFKNLKEIHTLKNAKHIPHKSDFDQIQEKIMLWVD